MFATNTIWAFLKAAGPVVGPSHVVVAPAAFVTIFWAAATPASLDVGPLGLHVVADVPAADETAADELAVDEPAADEPADEPAADEPDAAGWTELEPPADVAPLLLPLVLLVDEQPATTARAAMATTDSVNWVCDRRSPACGAILPSLDVTRTCVLLVGKLDRPAELAGR